MTFLSIFVAALILINASTGSSTKVASNGTDAVKSIGSSELFSAAGVDRESRGAFTDWFLSHRGVSDESGEWESGDDSKTGSNLQASQKSFFTHWCDWFGQRKGVLPNGTVYTIPLCAHHRRNQFNFMKSLGITKPTTSAPPRGPLPIEKTSIFGLINSTGPAPKEGSHTKTRQTVIVIHRVVEPLKFK